MYAYYTHKFKLTCHSRKHTNIPRAGDTVLIFLYARVHMCVCHLTDRLAAAWQRELRSTHKRRCWWRRRRGNGKLRCTPRRDTFIEWWPRRAWRCRLHPAMRLRRILEETSLLRARWRVRGHLSIAQSSDVCSGCAHIIHAPWWWIIYVYLYLGRDMQTLCAATKEHTFGSRCGYQPRAVCVRSN